MEIRPKRPFYPLPPGPTPPPSPWYFCRSQKQLRSWKFKLSPASKCLLVLEENGQDCVRKKNAKNGFFYAFCKTPPCDNRACKKKKGSILFTALKKNTQKNRIGC